MITAEKVELVRLDVSCDGCFKKLEDGTDVFCEHCRLLPDRHVEPKEIAEGVREWARENRVVLTNTELELLDSLADHIERGTRP